MNTADGVEKSFVFTHKEFSIAFNRDRIIEVNLTSGNPVPVEADIEIPMTYSVKWTMTDKPFQSRFDRYLDLDFFEHKTHWFAMFNSFMVVVFLCGVVALIILRTVCSGPFALHCAVLVVFPPPVAPLRPVPLRLLTHRPLARRPSDTMRYVRDEEADLDLDSILEDSGWRQLHNDVHRPPAFLPLLSALVGVGAQLVSLCFGCALAILFFGAVYDERGKLMMTVGRLRGYR